MSEHSSGNAVDIAADQRHPDLAGHQGEGSITEITIQRLLTLQGTMKPAPDHLADDVRGDATTRSRWATTHDHIHVGFQPLYGDNSKMARQVNAILKPEQWIKLIDRLGEIDNPIVPRDAVEVRAAGHAARRRRRTRATERRPGAASASSSGSSRAGSGPTPGRYVVRRFAGDDARHVLVIGGFDGAGAQRRAARGRARAERGRRRRSRSRARR